MSFELTGRRIDPARMLRRVSGGRAGGVALFVGRVRADRTPRGRVRALRYEAYAPLARQEMRRLEQRARGRWSLERVAVVHRVGLVPVGEPSVIVVVAAPHRAEAFQACRFLIDELKRKVPIWKTDVVEARRSRSGSPPPRPPSPARGRAAG